MISITVEDAEYWNEKTGEFLFVKGQTLQLEHSLVSIAKWESKWHKPFLSIDQPTREQSVDYIRCMTVTQNVNPGIYKGITDEHIRKVNEYISDPMSAKIFHKPEGKGSVKRDITSEEIYYSMVSYQIPFECQKWHFNRLMALIRTCDQHNSKDEGRRMRTGEYARWRSKVNAARKAKLNTRG